MDRRSPQAHRGRHDRSVVRHHAHGAPRGRPADVQDFPRQGGRMRQGRAQAVARSLGWFSIGLGLAELVAPRLVARASGLAGCERLVQLYGVREISSGASPAMRSTSRRLRPAGMPKPRPPLPPLRASRRSTRTRRRRFARDFARWSTTARGAAFRNRRPRCAARQRIAGSPCDPPCSRSPRKAFTRRPEQAAPAACGAPPLARHRPRCRFSVRPGAAPSSFAALRAPGCPR